MNSPVLGVATGAKLVLVDSLYMYGPAGDPMSEASPEHATSKRAPWHRPPPRRPGAFFRDHPGVYALSLAGALGAAA